MSWLQGIVGYQTRLLNPTQDHLYVATTDGTEVIAVQNPRSSDLYIGSNFPYSAGENVGYPNGAIPDKDGVIRGILTSHAVAIKATISRIGYVWADPHGVDDMPEGTLKNCSVTDSLHVEGELNTLGLGKYKNTTANVVNGGVIMCGYVQDCSRFYSHCNDNNAPGVDVGGFCTAQCRINVAYDLSDQHSSAAISVGAVGQNARSGETILTTAMCNDAQVSGEIIVERNFNLRGRIFVATIYDDAAGESKGFIEVKGSALGHSQLNLAFGFENSYGLSNGTVIFHGKMTSKGSNLNLATCPSSNHQCFGRLVAHQNLHYRTAVIAGKKTDVGRLELHDVAVVEIDDLSLKSGSVLHFHGKVDNSTAFTQVNDRFSTTNFTTLELDLIKTFPEKYIALQQ
eukprot:Awhi_evm1s1809